VPCMLGLALCLLALVARTAQAMPEGDDAAWAAAWAHAGLSPGQIEQLRVDVSDQGWRLTVRGASFVVLPPRDQAAREDLASLVASALANTLPAPGTTTPPTCTCEPVVDDPLPTVPEAAEAPIPAERGWTPYLQVETGARFWAGRAPVSSHTLTFGAARDALRSELSALVTGPASVGEAGPGRAQTSARLAAQVGVGTHRAAALLGMGVEGSRFTEGRATVERGALPDASITFRARPHARVPLVLGGSLFRTLGITRLDLEGADATLSPWRLGLSIAYTTAP
jgi:hypothetical protein